MIAFDLLVLQPEPGQVIRQVQVLPADTEKMKAMPGIVGYFVQPQDSLWDVAKHFHTTEDSILASTSCPAEKSKQETA